MIHNARYECDMCHNFLDSHKQLWTLQVLARSGGQSLSEGSTHGKLEVCRPCRQSLGILIKEIVPPPPKPYPTIQELITQIIERCQP